jgi:hypothetical protein
MELRPVVPGEWQLDGRVYGTREEYDAAVAKRKARRDRLQAMLDAETGL